jgi:hypothetical protein
VFTNRAAFDTWHTTKCAELGIPHPGRNHATQDPAILKQWTTAAVDPVSAVGVTRVFADVPDEWAAGLTPVTVTFATDPETLIMTMTVVVGGQSRTMVPITDDSWRQPKLARVTVDGVEYDTTTGTRTTTTTTVIVTPTGGR